MITIEHDHPDYIVCRASGTLTKGDYAAAVPELDNALAMREAPHRLMVRLEDFRGWEIGALWADIKFDLRHWNDFDRVAVVREAGVEEWDATLSKPFVNADIRYYTADETGEAEAWLAR